MEKQIECFDHILAVYALLTRLNIWGAIEQYLNL